MEAGIAEAPEAPTEETGRQASHLKSGKVMPLLIAGLIPQEVLSYAITLAHALHLHSRGGRRSGVGAVQYG